MEIQQLVGFLAVARSGSFSKAAQKTFRSQPAISLQIKALEDELKTRLFDRSGPHKVRLTDDGRLLYDLVEPAVGNIMQLGERFDEARNQLDRFQVTVASHNSAILYLLPRVVHDFAEQYPNARLTIVNRGREGILAMVKNDEAQIGITSIRNLPAWAGYEVLGKYRRVLVCRKDHPLKGIKKISLQDLAKHPLILPPAGSMTRDAIDRAFREKGIAYDLALEVVGREEVKNFIEIGIGVSIMSEYYLTREGSRNLIVKDVSADFGHGESGILVRKGRHLNRAAVSFIELVRREAGRNMVSSG